MKKNKLEPVCKLNKDIMGYLNYDKLDSTVYKSPGLIKHISKRHPECVKYMPHLPLILKHPDYIGINPNESGRSLEIIKRIDENVLIGIKVDEKDKYYYIATVHTITESKLTHRIKSGRVKPV